MPSWQKLIQKFGDSSSFFIEKERPREHEACGIEAAEEEEMVGPPPKKTKGEKALETPKSSETADTTENVQEESVDYNQFYG